MGMLKGKIAIKLFKSYPDPKGSPLSKSTSRAGDIV